jgi:hypothetical protein
MSNMDFDQAQIKSAQKAGNKDQQSAYILQYTVKKVHEFPVSSLDVTNQNPPGQE